MICRAGWLCVGGQQPAGHDGHSRPLYGWGEEEGPLLPAVKSGPSPSNSPSPQKPLMGRRAPRAFLCSGQKTQGGEATTEMPPEGCPPYRPRQQPAGRNSMPDHAVHPGDRQPSFIYSHRSRSMRRNNDFLKKENLEEETLECGEKTSACPAACASFSPPGRGRP